MRTYSTSNFVSRKTTVRQGLPMLVVAAVLLVATVAAFAHAI